MIQMKLHYHIKAQKFVILVRDHLLLIIQTIEQYKIWIISTHCLFVSSRINMLLQIFNDLAHYHT